jgi:hypothetical protein
MKTQCNQNTFLFPAPISRPVVAQFDGGNITSDAGGLLLQRVEQAKGILRQFGLNHPRAVGKNLRSRGCCQKVWNWF